MEIFKRLYPYKDLFFIYVWREFTIRYRHSIIGVLWALIQPLSMMALLTFIFTYVMDIRIKDYPKAVFFLAGLLPWTFFSSSINQSINSLAGQHSLIRKIYFPREIIPISRVLAALFDFFIAFLLFPLILFIHKIPITWTMLWVIPLVMLLFFFTVSMSLLLSSINVYYRDVRLASEFFIRLLFFASPILYSIDGLSIKLKLILLLNPLTFIIENMRRCMIEGRGVILWQFVFVGVILVILYYISYRFFIRTERAFADVI
ncbi:MAG TPA: ABC transporter permease [Thermodesulfobacteriota bacterium]|nr:ABC transporter permease [Thermodesulfobacteriota bacterium]